jgi:hypothetical protein
MGYSAAMAPKTTIRPILTAWPGVVSTSGSQLAGLSADQALTEQIARLFAAANTRCIGDKAAQGAQYAATTGTPSAAASSGTALMTWASSESA